MSIEKRQNYPDSLDKLAAQRLLYRCAKWMRSIDLISIVMIIILGFMASVIDHKDFSHFVPFIVVITWFFSQQIIKLKENKLKTEAALIQEDFDCFVLALPWSTYKGISRPIPERIKQLAVKAVNKSIILEELKDWYNPTMIPEEPILASIHCQRINCWWDLDLRRNWINMLYVIIGIFSFLIFGLSIWTGITVVKLFAIIASGIRLIAWVLDECRNQNKAIKHIDMIHRHLSSFSDQSHPSLSDLRSIQDQIFEHRCSNIPVPGWFYRRRRDDQELEARNFYGSGSV